MLTPPVGLSARALHIISARLRGELEPVLRLNPDVDGTDLIDLEERVDTSSWAWRLGKHGMTNVVITAETILGRSGYIRLDNRSIPAQAFSATAARLPGVEVTTHHITSQLNFPLTAEPALVDLAHKLRTVVDEQAKAKRAS